MEKIERIDPANITDEGIIVSIPYTSSIFVFQNSFIDGKSKYFSNTLEKDDLNLGEYDEEIPNMPIKVSYRTLLLQPHLNYFIIVDGTPYLIYLVKYNNNAIMSFKEAKIDNLSDSVNNELFEALLDEEQVYEKIYYYINNRLKLICGGDNLLDSSDLFSIFHKDNKGILIRGGYDQVNASLVRCSESDNHVIDFNLSDYVIDGIDYGMLTSFFDKEQKEKTLVLH